MDPVLANLIQSVIVETVKIVGPATVAVFATYKVSKIQFEVKIKEIEKQQEFGARKQLFDHYKNSHKEMLEKVDELSGSLGILSGITSSIKDGIPTDAIESKILTAKELAVLYLKMAPFDISSTLEDMENHKLEKSNIYKRIIELEGVESRHDKLNTIDDIEKLIFELIEIYGILSKANSHIFNTQIEDIFKKYID